MTLYEELGVAADAPQNAIREAYRNVVRLLHPDAQTNPVLKQSAEVQMKRINHLYSILSDPDRRRRYDEDLVEPKRLPDQAFLTLSQAAKPFGGRDPGMAVWLFATVFCAIFVIWLATRESPASMADPQAETSTPRTWPAANSALSGKDKSRNDEMVRLRSELAAANADRARLLQQIAAMQGSHTVAPVPAPPIQSASATPPGVERAVEPTPEVSIPLSAPAPAQKAPEPPRARWAGSWAYNLASKNTSQAPNAPEFIETVISEENGRIRGQYHARFKVQSAAISPDVNFLFEGKISGTSGRFPWTGTGGAKGEVQLRLVSDTALEVVWATTDLGKTMGLVSGTAVLNRKN